MIAKLKGAVVEALADHAVRQRLADLGQGLPARNKRQRHWSPPQGQNGEVVADFIKATGIEAR